MQDDGPVMTQNEERPASAAGPAMTAHDASPLRIDALATPGGGLIGLTHCPGRLHPRADGVSVMRDLAADIRAIEGWGANIEPDECARLGAPDLLARLAVARFRWLHLPIADMGVPDAAGIARWRALEPELTGALGGGGRVLLHCAAGLGRSGMMAARLLLACAGSDPALTPAAAVARVRAARPGAVETEAQESFVRESFVQESFVGRSGPD
jgi:hypothetical protein